MPNFHADMLAIAADEENMKKVLTCFALNLVANQEYTNFDISAIDGLDSIKELYCEVGPVIDTYYMYAFASTATEVNVSSTDMIIGWTSPTSSENGFLAQVQALQSRSEELSAELPEISNFCIKINNPGGSPVSDTATLSFDRYGKYWVLTISYDTAWSPNSEDLDKFFMALPTGEYGVAFYDADEGDGYEMISVFSGIHHGSDTMHATEGEREWGIIERKELKGRKAIYDGTSKEGISDLVMLARIGATCHWKEWGWDEGNDGYYSEQSVNFRDHSLINWVAPQDKDIQSIDKLLAQAIAAFPWCNRLYSGFSPQGNEAAEYLFPGDSVMITSDWNDFEINGRNVIFNVSDMKGTCIGRLSGWIQLFDGYENSDSALPLLACLLPYLKTTVYENTPVSLRNKGVEGPNLTIRFDLDSIDFGRLVSEVHELLTKDLCERMTSSKAGE